MATQVPIIGRPNYRAIAGMPPADIVRAREFYLVKMITARRGKDTDTLLACVDWIEALTSEMRLRGGTKPQQGVTL